MSLSDWLVSLDDFISPRFLIAVVRTSHTMLNKSGGSGHPCLVPDLKVNTYSFCPWSIVLAVICHMWPSLS